MLELLSADMGADGGAAAATDTGVDAGAVDTGAGVDAGAEPVDESAELAAFAQQHGGLQKLQQITQQYQQLDNLHRYNPEFREYLASALRGERGPQAKADAQQQVQQQQGGQQPQQQQPPRQKMDAAMLAGMQGYHRELERARNSDDPQAVQRVQNDPQFAKAKEAYQQRMEEMNGFWWDSDSFLDKALSAPERQQARQQEMQQAIQQAILPMQERFEMASWNQWYQGDNKRDYDSMPQHIRDALERGVYGPVGAVKDGRTAQDWINASQAAIANAKRLAQTGQQPPRQPGAAAPQNGQPQARPGTNGIKQGQRPQKSEAEELREYARAEAKEKLAAAGKR